MLTCGASSSGAAFCQRKAAVYARGTKLCATRGFGDDAPAKINDRGKISSRPGPASPKDVKRRQEEAKAGLARETPIPAPAEQATQKPDSSASSSTAIPSAVSAPASSRSTASEPVSASNRPPQQETPQVVVDRMFKRMIVCAATPVVLGLMLLPVFLALKQADEDFPLWIVYFSQLLTFGGGLLGITYGILSTSWDPTREGTFLGFTELQANLPILMNRGDKK